MLQRIFASLFGMLLIASFTFVTRGEASCGSANCFLVTGTQEGIASPGQIIFDLSYRWIPMDQVQRGSDSSDIAEVPRIDFANGVIVPGGHTEIRTNNQLMQLDISYGLSSAAALTLTVPFMNDRVHEHAHEDGEITRQDGASGFGDIRLIGKIAPWVTTRHLAVLGVGVKLPTGEYKLLDHEGEINEPTIQPGSGSWDPLFSVHYSYQITPHQWDAFLGGSYQLATENPKDYRFGNTFILNGGTSASLTVHEKTATGSLQLNLRHAPRDEFHGEEVPSTGGTSVYLTPGLRLSSSSNTSFYTHVQWPIYQRVNEVNLVPRYGLIFGVSHAF
jgi:hypothetical protein